VEGGVQKRGDWKKIENSPQPSYQVENYSHHNV